jgi:F-type H+-transporting ATPase subunit b
MEILNQLGGLVLGSVPTMILFVLLIWAYQVLVGKPLARTLAERRARTSGAVEQARTAIAAAEAETAAFEEKLRQARAEIQAERDRNHAEWQATKDAALAQARSLGQDRVRAAKKEIEASALVARQQIEGATEQLSEQILRAVLPSAGSYGEARS